MVSHIRRSVDEGYETGLWNPASPHIVIFLRQAVYLAGNNCCSLKLGVNGGVHDWGRGNADRREDIGFVMYDS
jgi:hypothetical protein